MAVSQPGCPKKTPPILPAPAPRARHQTASAAVVCRFTCQDLCSGRQRLFEPRGSPQWETFARPPKPQQCRRAASKMGGVLPPAPKPGHDPPWPTLAHQRAQVVSCPCCWHRPTDGGGRMRPDHAQLTGRHCTG